MKYLRITLKWCIALLLFANIALLVSGKTYLYKALYNTYLKGRIGPSIDEYKIFPNAVIKAREFISWPISQYYNKRSLPPHLLKEIETSETISFLVVKDDSIRYERYWEDYNDSSVTNSFSMAKTIMSILIGIAIDEGKIKSVDQALGDFIPVFNQGKGKQLTIKHLLTMSSGINFDEDYKNPFAYPAKAYYGNDLIKLTLEYEVVASPGITFKYLSGNTALLGMVLEKATNKSISEYASEKLWIPIGARHNAYWSLDHEKGLAKSYCCFNSNARDFARLGQLYLKKGKINDKIIVSQEYVEASVKPAELLDENGLRNEKYGYSWWLLNYEGNKVFYARGILGQYIFVIPSRNMVVVRLGRKRSKQQEKGHPIDVYNYLDAAIELVN